MHLVEPPVLSKPMSEEPLFLYLAVTENAVSTVLVQEEDRSQKPVYYISKRLLEFESKYPLIEKLAFCPILASRKLWPWLFLAHSNKRFNLVCSEM